MTWELSMENFDLLLKLIYIVHLKIILVFIAMQINMLIDTCKSFTACRYDILVK